MGDSTTTRTSLTISDALKQRYNEIAYEQSTPNDTVTASEVMREALHAYVEAYNAATADPKTKGSIDYAIEIDGVEQNEEVA